MKPDQEKPYIDLHVHIADLDSMRTAKRLMPFLRFGTMVTGMLRSAFFGRDVNLRGSVSNSLFLSRLSRWVKESRLDKAVLLALDGVYDASGRYRSDRTRLRVRNSFVRQVSEENPAFLFGASIHPYRPDAVALLEQAIKQGACLIKWIPSAQRILPDASRCFAFYEAMAHYQIPLLTHTGVEHSLGSKRGSYNHPNRLIPALKRGVTVIAAHCGTRIFLYERSFFTAWAMLARKHERFFGDLGAFPMVTRIPALQKILRDNDLRQKVLYGSDYPSIPSPAWCWQLSLKKIRALCRISNPLERNVQVMRALGVPESFFTRAGQILSPGEGEG